MHLNVLAEIKAVDRCNRLKYVALKYQTVEASLVQHVTAKPVFQK